MIEIVGVRFKKVGKIYYFDPDNMKIERGTEVIVETAMGIEYGTVEIANREIEEEGVVQPLKKVIRIATKKEKIKNQEKKQKEKDAFLIF